MWFGKNDNKWDDEECACKMVVKTLSLKEIKEKLACALLQEELEQHFFKVLDDE